MRCRLGAHRALTGSVEEHRSITVNNASPACLHAAPVIRLAVSLRRTMCDIQLDPDIGPQLRLYGHVARLCAEDPAHRIISRLDPSGWTISRRRPHASWLRQVFMVESSEGFEVDAREDARHGRPGVCLGDGQTEADVVPTRGGRGDALLRRMPLFHIKESRQWSKNVECMKNKTTRKKTIIIEIKDTTFRSHCELHQV